MAAIADFVMATTKKFRYSKTEVEQTQAWEQAGEEEFPDLPADYDEAAEEPVCPQCGELLAWHEPVPCAPRPPVVAQSPVAEPPASKRESFAYALGHRVLPLTQAQAYEVVWRGQLKERHPVTGLVQRTNVYRLGDGYWDCYREEELLAA